MANSIKVNTENVEFFEGVLAAFRSDIEKLVRLTRKYPVEIEFGDYRFVFDKRSEIEELIRVLDKKVSDVRAAA